MACCRKDMVRGLAKLEGRLVKVVQWAVGQRREEQERREEREGQRLVCGRLHTELAVMREYRGLREQERERREGRERRKKEQRERLREHEERGRRERERGDILAWRRNRIEVANLSRLQLEEEVREVLRGRKLREARNHFRIKFREEERGRKIVEEDERKREKEDEEREREGRMEGLRRVARRRLGLHLMPRDVRWVQG